MSKSLFKLQPFGMLPTFLVFGVASGLLSLAIGPIRGWLVDSWNVRPVVGWFIAGGFCVFVPLLLFAAALLSLERHKHRRIWHDRLRFRRMTKADVVWTIGGLISIGGSTGSVLILARVTGFPLDLSPDFMEMEQIGEDRLWILAAWIPFFFLNISAEEILWRGVILPRQEISFGAHAWIVNGLGWLAFHLSFGMDMILMLMPTILILPYVVQRRGNCWIGVILHAFLNALGFLGLALGLN